MADPTVLGRRNRENGLEVGSRKRIAKTDVLTHHGRHFGRAIYSFSNIRAIITNGLRRAGEDNAEPEHWTANQRQEQAVYAELLKLCPELEDRLLDCSVPEEIQLIADLIQKGANSSRADDTKGMKGSVVDWITPEGQNLNPPLNRRYKDNRGFNHDATGALLCPAGVDWSKADIKQKLASGEKIVAGHHWPLFIYADSAFDTNDPWKGLLRSILLVKAFKHVFISPSAADIEDGKITTKSGNARIHGMKKVTKASIVYVATQVRFALTSATHWSRTDKVTDSENFYTSLLNTLEEPRYNVKVNDLLFWWDRKIFPYEVPETSLIPVEGSPLDRIRQMAAEEDINHASGSA